MKNQCEDKLACRRNKVGGAAVLEGVMMKSGDAYALTCRRPDGVPVMTKDTFTSVRKKHKVLNLPIIRGVVNFVEMMILNVKTLTKSTEAMGLEELEETKFEKWLREKFGRGVLDVVMGIAMVLGVVLGVGLFVFLPTLVASWINDLAGDSLGWWRTPIEGVMKIVIFVAYLLLVSLMKDIRRTFEYHGAEHKSIACYESGEELTPENARKHTRFHARCGTSFIFVILIISILVSSLITWNNVYLRAVLKILLLPVIVGVGFEVIMYSGKHDNPVIRVLSAPGLWMQRITTREPDDEQLRIAILSLKAVLPEDYPDFDPDPYLNAPPMEKEDGEKAETDAQ